MFSVSLHPDVVKFLDRLSENERKRCVDSLKKLEEDPFTPRSGGVNQETERRKEDYVQVEGWRFQI